MATTMLNIRLIQPRMMTLKQAAEYAGYPAKRFAAICGVAPIAMPGNVEMYDRLDLDRWIDQMKGSSQETDDELVDKL